MSSPIHRTTDVFLASFLHSERRLLLNSRRVTDKKVEFSFSADESFHRLLRSYWSGEPLYCVPSRLFDSYRTLKSRSVPPELIPQLFE